MKLENDRFDIVMAGLRAIEPSSSFDAEFKSRLGEAVAKRRAGMPLEMILKRLRLATEGLREILVPQAPALARAVAIFIVAVSAGLLIYSIQPLYPTVSAKEGIVMVQAAGMAAPKEIVLSCRLKPGDVVITRGDGQVDLGISNKYALRLKGNSTMKIARITPRYWQGSADFRLDEGMAMVSVDAGFKGSRFTITTKTAAATALGTKFSVETLTENKEETLVSVVQGKVKVRSQYRPGNILLAKQTVIVGAGQKTEVPFGSVPVPPSRLMAKEWEALEELYQIGKKPQVMLLVKNSPDRARQLLAPCAIVISDEKPREMPKLLEDALLKIADAIKTGDKAKHMESIKMLERMVNEHPGPKYNVQLLLYIGAYYEYLSYHEDAIKSFEKIILRYPDSPLASMAECAIGIIYEEKLNDRNKANQAYQNILKKYPDSLEAIWVEEKLGIKKGSRSTKNISITSVFISDKGDCDERVNT